MNQLIQVVYFFLKSSHFLHYREISLWPPKSALSVATWTLHTKTWVCGECGGVWLCICRLVHPHISKCRNFWFDRIRQQIDGQVQSWAWNREIKPTHLLFVKHNGAYFQLELKSSKFIGLPTSINLKLFELSCSSPSGLVQRLMRDWCVLSRPINAQNLY